MSKCEGKNYPGCSSCVNREFDPFECDDCEDESNWEGDDEMDTSDVEDVSISEFASMFQGEY